ncbi:rubredoxin, partial [Marinobacter sp. UBA2678]
MAKHQCPDCGYVYDEVVGDPHEGFPAGTTWEKIPEDWSCPDCAVRDKVDFVALQEANSELSVSATNIAVRTASQAKTEGASQKATDASTPSAKNKTKPKAKPKPTSSKSPKDSTQKDT